jgi:1,4-dihydroxy-2-naphthoate octaprenyltransferase
MTTVGPPPARRSVWIDAARPKTLPAAIAPVLIGTAAAAAFSLLRFALALLVALALQVAVNYANDYFDGVAGVDTAARLGPTRAVGSGQVAPAHMRTAMLAAFGVAAVSGLVLGALAGWGLVAVGALAMLAAVGYSGGPRPYASAGLGELFVFVFFGVVATAGSAYVQDERLVATALVASVTPGLIAVALLVVNNLRDVPTDIQAGKRTLSVRIGDAASRRLVTACVGGAVLGPLAASVMTTSPWPLLALLGLPLAARVLASVRTAQGRELVRVLARTGRLLVVVGVPFALGLLLA